MQDSHRRFETLLRPVRESLFRFALQLTTDPVAAEDLLQQATVVGLNRVGQLQADQAFRVWMSRIVYTQHLNAIKQRARRAPEGESLDADNVVELATARPNPEERAEAARLGRRIAAALDRLPPEQRDAVWLVDGQGFKYTEAAEILEIKPGTAASRVARARQALRVSLRRVAEEQGVVR